MQCPYCAALLPEDDLFCEECGQRLQTTDPPESGFTLCLCGASDDQLDADGYCLSCGRRCRPAPSDHLEIEISSELAAVSDRGLRHSRNEDRFAVRAKGDQSILVVCDGVSNSGNAEEAAALACECISTALVEGTSLPDALAQAGRQVAALAQPNALGSCPSTTVVAAVATVDQVKMAWLGDSRAYWISQEGARQLTADHSWMNVVVSSGELTASEAAKAPQAHGITRWLGADSNEDMRPDFIDFAVPGPGWLLLCTDGLWNHAPQPEDMAALVHECSPEGATALGIARRLIEFANRNGGQDNITAALLRWGAPH
ncbi:MAG: protein phosphatase 2C domain-containing protein [Acidobacteriaceae bacterium]|nr:protein phosphatase 2C domain-containing protein [Acidobacteriaceae bacterium]